MPSEPETRDIIEKAWSMGKVVCVPKCISDGNMVPVVIKNLNDVRTGKFGILEPVNSFNTISWEKIDIAVIPCVSADKKGNRLGHGAGYYDRFLHKTHMKKICLCFEQNVSEKIPTDNNDVSVDMVVTENGVYES